MEFEYTGALTYLMSHVQKLYRHRVDLLVQQYRVYPGQPPVLIQLADCDGQIQKELAERVSLTPATLNVMIRRMERAGLVNRKPDEMDQRISRVWLTDEGRIAAKEVAQALRTVEDVCFQDFSPEEMRLFRELLSRIHHQLLHSSS